MKIYLLLGRSLLLICAALIGLLAANSPEPQAYDHLQALASGAGVVVTVFGIWIAIIYPLLGQQVEGGADRRTLPENFRYRRLLESLARASIVLIGSLLLVVVLPYSSGSTWLLRFLVAIFGVLCVISLAESLLFALVAGEAGATDGLSSRARSGFLKRRNRKNG